MPSRIEIKKEPLLPEYRINKDSPSFGRLQGEGGPGLATGSSERAGATSPHPPGGRRGTGRPPVPGAPPPAAPRTGDGGAALEREAVVAVGADEEAVGAAPQEVSQGLAELGVAEVLVETHQDGADGGIERRLGPIGGRGTGQGGGAGPQVRDTDGLQLGGQRGAAQHVGGGAERQGLAEVAGGAVGRAEDVPGLGGGEAQPPQFLGVGRARPAAVVGHVAEAFTRRRQPAQGRRRAAHRRFSPPQHAVAVEEQRVGGAQHGASRLCLQPPAPPRLADRHGRHRRASAARPAPPSPVAPIGRAAARPRAPHWAAAALRAPPTAPPSPRLSARHHRRRPARSALIGRPPHRPAPRAPPLARRARSPQALRDPLGRPAAPGAR